MEVELIPVIKVNCNYDDVAAPSCHPYWEHPEEWEEYNRACLSRSGYSHLLIPYLRGHLLFPIVSIQENDLLKILIEHTEGLRTGVYQRQDVAGIPGGYILRVNGKDVYFPQCCGELNDIGYWAGLADRNTNSYYEGHPSPVVSIERDLLVFDFSVDKHEEPFQPTPLKTILKIKAISLQKAVSNAKKELDQLSIFLNKINVEQGWVINDLDDLLIWSNPNRR